MIVNPAASLVVTSRTTQPENPYPVQNGVALVSVVPYVSIGSTVLGLNGHYPKFIGTKIFWGLDLSLRSPGICLRSEGPTPIVYLTGFLARKKELCSVKTWGHTGWYVAMRPKLPEAR